MFQLFSERGALQHILALLIIIISRRPGYDQIAYLTVLLRNKLNVQYSVVFDCWKGRPLMCLYSRMLDVRDAVESRRLSVIQ